MAVDSRWAIRMAVRSLEQDVEGGLDLGLRLQVEVGGGLVEHQDPGLGQEGPGQGDELALARRQRLAALVDDGVEAVGQCGRSPRSGRPCRTASSDLRRRWRRAGRRRCCRGWCRRRGTAPGAPRRAGGAASRMVTSRRSWPSMRTRPGGRVVEAGDQLGHGRLAGSGGARRRPPSRPGSMMQVDVVEDRDVRVVAEGHVVEDDLARRWAAARRRRAPP